MARARAKYELHAEDKTGTGLRSAEGRLLRFGRFVASRVVIPIESLFNAIRALPAMLDQVKQKWTEIGDLARNTAVSVEEAASIQLAAQRIGVDPDQFRDISATLSERFRDARTNKEYAAAFKELRIDLEKIEQLGTLAQLVEVSEAFQNLGPGAARAVSEALGLGEGRLGILRSDLAEGLARSGQLGLIGDLGEQTRLGQENRALRAEALAIVRDTFAPLVEARTRAENAILSEIVRAQEANVAFERQFSGTFTLGTARLERAGLAIERAASELSTRGVTATYKRLGGGG